MKIEKLNGETKYNGANVVAVVTDAEGFNPAELVESLIYLKDKLKYDGYSWRDYDCINDACNVLEKL